MIPLLLTMTMLGAEPTEEQTKLLKTFREEFILLTPGEGGFPASFMMGRDTGPENERPPHEVTLAYPFHVARYEVPQDLWEAVMGANPSLWKGPRNSVEMLSRGDAVAFCEQSTNLMRAAGLIEPQEVIRLPSEAEWEYFARAGTTTLYSFGADDSDLDDYAWHTGNAAGNDPPVGAKKPNAWGLYDVYGYLWEWCADTWHADYQGAPADGSRWESDASAMAPAGVLRGGSWKDPAEMLTSSFRRKASADTRDDAVGLRCVLAKEQSPAAAQ